MKIGFDGIELPEGKVKYHDDKLIALEQKDKPKKVVPFFAEFIKEEFVQTDVIVVTREKILDLLILDMEKADGRLEGAGAEEKAVLEKCMENLEKEIPLCDVNFNEEEAKIVTAASFLSSKPVVVVEGDDLDVNMIISMALDKADYMFFYTTGPKESHAWFVKKNTDIVTCAGKIHSDLARGFIRGDVVSFDDYMSYHNFNDCKSKGVARVVDKDYIVQPNEIIEIRFNV